MNKGYVYKLWTFESDDIYIGSTKEKYLSSRLSHHKAKSNHCVSRELFEKYQDVKIEALEVFMFDDISELRAREGHYQRTLKCINYKIENRTRKEYRQENLEKIKKHRQENLEKIKEQKQKHYQNNKEQIKEYNQEYYQNNKERIDENRKQIVTCICGCEIRKSDLSKHLKTNKHFKILELVK